MSDARTSKAASLGELENQATEWLVLREGGWSVAEEEQFRIWRNADPRHAAAMRSLESAWNYMNGPLHTGKGWLLKQEANALIGRRSRLRRHRVAACSIVCLAAAFVALVNLMRPLVHDNELAVASGRVEVRPDRLVLADGSVVELNADAEIETHFVAAERDVRLLRGEAHFAVTKNPARPFVVTVGTMQVRAVGTAFAVRFETKAVDVLVTEGRVAVEPSALPKAGPVDGSKRLSAPVYVSAGGRVTVPFESPTAIASPVAHMSPAEMNEALSWRERRLEFTAMPLSEVLGLLNRRNVVQVELATKDLGAQRVSGVFWSDDPEGFSRLIAASADLEAVSVSANRIVLRRSE
jgi:transmembrane sensor